MESTEPVRQASDQIQVAPDPVYVIPPRRGPAILPGTRQWLGLRKMAPTRLAALSGHANRQGVADGLS